MSSDVINTESRPAHSLEVHLIEESRRGEIKAKHHGSLQKEKG